MISDSITSSSAIASPNARDSAKNKKKKNNKSAKMKQNKLGLRREHWLSQVAVTKETSVTHREKPVESLDDSNDRNLCHENLDDSNYRNLRHEKSFMESPSSSSMGGTDILTNFSERSSRSSSSSSSSDDDGCVDDWEALADALEAEEEEEEEKKLLHESVKEEEKNVEQSSSRSDRAWRQDDNHRPQGLPNLAKQLSYPELDKRIPASCPICYEDLDFTDSCFFPCPCGFRLCLFCHKTISDGDGRCPGCRKPYERIFAETSLENGGLTVRLTRSSSMFSRF